MTGGRELDLPAIQEMLFSDQHFMNCKLNDKVDLPILT